MLGKPVRSLIDLGLWNLATEGWVYSFEQCFIDKSKRKRGFPHFLLIKVIFINFTCKNIS